MKRVSRKRSSSKEKTESRPDQIRAHIEFLLDEHTGAWQSELFSDAPRWPVVLGLHLRLSELEHLEQGAGELL